jgi:hypothetical protein
MGLFSGLQIPCFSGLEPYIRELTVKLSSFHFVQCTIETEFNKRLQTSRTNDIGVIRCCLLAYLSVVARIRGKPELSSDVRRIRGKKTHLLLLLDLGEG